jgi:putative protease
MSEQRVGVVTHWFSHLHVATVKLEAPLKLGDRVHLKGAHDDFRVKVTSMQVEHAPVEKADAGQHVGIRCGSKKAHEGDVVYRVEGDGGWLGRLLGRWGG